MSPSPAALPAPNTDLFANVFDVLHLPAFVVDRDFNIIDFNLAGARLLDHVPFSVMRLRRGNQLQCVHSIDAGEDAAAEACPECIGKNFVREVFGQASARRNTGRLRLIKEGKPADVDFVITVAPVPDESEPLALVLLDDAAELSALLESKGRPATPVSSSPGSRDRAKARGRKTGNS